MIAAAVAMANANRVPEAKRKLEALLATQPEQSVGQEAERLLRELAQVGVRSGRDR